jgi:hypothetical protein
MVGQLQEILIWGNVLKLQADMAAASIAPAVSCSSFFKSQTFDPELGLKNILCSRVICKVALSACFKLEDYFLAMFCKQGEHLEFPLGVSLCLYILTLITSS